MKQVHLLFAAALLVGSSLHAQPNFTLQPFASGLSEPVDITNAGDDRLFIVEKRGAIQILNARGAKIPTPFLDIDPQVSTGSERGLLGMAFHPEYATNGYFYVNYTNNAGNTVISRFTRSALNPNVADPASEVILLTVTQPFSNHNAGDLNFGPDGYLYIALGDGGSFGDPGNRSQTKTNLLGKVLRIDVDSGSPYGIPADNPFVGDPTYAPEIWALGVRNPWRCSFDALTGDYWIADVGQDDWEEVNVQPASSTGGENYGWRCYEGDEPYNLSGCSSIGTYDFPVFVYPHNFTTGGISITGGYVYRGIGNPSLYGKYLFCDYLSGNWWALEDNGSGGYIITPYGNVQSLISTFGEDAENELYAANLSTGQIYKIVENCNAGSIVTGLDAIVLGPNSVSLAWDALPNADGYQINGRAVGAPNFSKIQTTATQRSVNILTASTNYEWFVRARCNDLSITAPSTLKNFSTPALRQAVALQVLQDGQQLYFDAPASGQWMLHDLAGRLVRQGQTLEGRNPVSTQQLPDGLYVLSTQTETGQYRSALVPSVQR
ncbi:MAG: cadherin [Bacteroidetes bacterium]|nr:cadherin [Bacteroidota bacterium]